MPDILLATLNARHVHASLGLRYLHANLGELAPRARIREFVIGAATADLVESLLAEAPRVIGFGVYIWNVEETTRAVAMLKRVAPGVAVVIGGPEVSFETGEQRICAIADYVVTGQGDLAFAALCRRLLAGEPPPARIIEGGAPDPRAIVLPYALYTDEDLRHRFVYVEASRGCPFRCEFCLSSLDKTAVPFDPDALLAELARLHERGARHFRFVDRTFNLKAAAGLAILEFFLARLDERLFLHFEVIPDHLPDALKSAIARFPAGSLQFEVGVQTWNPQVQALISRRQDNAKTGDNLRWLRAQSNALVHADLIAGLPGEDMESFARGFDRLHALGPHEIQVGILKRLRGTPIARHTGAFSLRFNPDPPYNVLATDRLTFAQLQRIARFARVWERVGNSGRFRHTLGLLLGDAPFANFMNFTDWLHAAGGRTHSISLERLFEHVLDYLRSQPRVGADRALEAATADYAASGAHGRPDFMPGGVSGGRQRPPGAARLRQARHVRSEGA